MIEKKKNSGAPTERRRGGERDGDVCDDYGFFFLSSTVAGLVLNLPGRAFLYRSRRRRRTANSGGSRKGQYQCHRGTRSLPVSSSS